MSTNIPHYFPKDLDQHDLDIIKRMVTENALHGPVFIGQGLTEGVGSDAYGYYIVAKKQIGKKTIWGIAEACSQMHGTWYEGTMDCSINMDTATPSKWITSYGKWKTGNPKWWFCDEEGNRFKGRFNKAKFHWNGAAAYRDPSF